MKEGRKLEYPEKTIGNELQKYVSEPQEKVCLDNGACCHTEIEVADLALCLTQSQYTDTRPTSFSTDPTAPAAWRGSHWSTNVEVTGMIQRGKRSPV